MASVYDTLSSWARRTTTSFAELRMFDRAPDPLVAEGAGQIYRLKYWPQLGPALKNADVFRTLSMMSHRPVNRRWILASSRLTPRQVDTLIESLVKQDAVEITHAKHAAAPAAGK